MSYARPEASKRPCPACGTLVEPLRAGAVLLLEQEPTQSANAGFRFFCDTHCRQRFLQGERRFERATLARERQHDEPARVSLPPEPQQAMHAQAFERASLGYRMALAAALVGAVASALSERPAPAWFAAAVAIVVAWTPLILHRDPNVVWEKLPSSLGASVAAIAGLLAAFEHRGGPWLLLSANAASALLVVRTAIDSRAGASIASAAQRLVDRLPLRVRIADAGEQDADMPAVLEKDARRVRAGEEVLVLEGESIGVDGVVRAGEARVLPHAGASAAISRGVGDSVLAGGYVVEGSLRVLATRVADDRAACKPPRFGDGLARDAARMTKLTRTLARWAPLAVLGSSVSAFVLASDATWSGHLAALSAALLGVPLLSLRRGAERPMIAAAASAVERGIVFQTPRALERAGGTTRAVLCTHGTITEGRPEVIEIFTVDGVAPEPFIGLAAAAEAATESHPIARAIQSFAQSRGIANESVRRAVHLPGRGVTALAPGGEPFVLGNRQLLLDEGVSVAMIDEEAARAESRARTVLFFGLGGRVRGIISLTDPLRSGARASVQRMMDLGQEVVLLSGDHRGTVEALARGLDIDHVKAELLPDERGTEVQRLREAGGPVAVLGRPMHDDAALFAANVPIVLGAAGGPAGDSAVALVSEDLRDAASSLWIARAARAASRRAIVATLIVAVGIELCVSVGWVGPLLATLAAVGVDAFALPAGSNLLARVAKRIPVRE